MRLAKDIKGYKMTSTSEFNHNLTTLIAQETITRVIETGSYLGNGTTKAVLKGFKLHDFEYKFISLEVNPEYYKSALANNIGSGILFINALSVPRKMIPVSITIDAPDYVIVDHLNLSNYSNEIQYDVPDSMLNLAVELKPELVILDSAGHLGLIEFNYLMSLLPSHEFYLALDDINHIKHYHTMELIKQNQDKFQIIWQSQTDQDHQSSIIQVNAS